MAGRARRQEEGSYSDMAEQQAAVEQQMEHQMAEVRARASSMRLTLVSRAFQARMSELLVHVFAAWKGVVSREVLLRLEEERKEELHENVSRLSLLDNELNMVRRGSVLERQALDGRLSELAGEAASAHKAAEEAQAAAEVRVRAEEEQRAEDERKASAKMSNILERMQRERLKQLVARIIVCWRGLVLASQVDGSQAAALKRLDELASQQRLAEAAREVNARRTEMVRSEARLEGQARIQQLEAALRKAELDGADKLRQAELRAEERRMADARTHQLHLAEAQSALRIDRANRDSNEEALRREVQAGHEAELAELAQLRRERKELEGVSADRNGGWIAEQSTQPKQITALQLQLAELQRELQMRDDDHQHYSAQQGGGGGGGGFFEGLFGGGFGGDGSPPRSPTRRAHTSGREAELAAQLDEKSAEAASLSVQLSNLKVAMGNQEQMLMRMRHPQT